ncbi:diguanylate cyclase (GGDEF) domain-containing protein [Ruminococcaceae bacterium YRB3002]|nr:diguanylate cyclase (GGDEF) domain-containing protein [Ruminococcaceae bacterium YRB3002]
MLLNYTFFYIEANVVCIIIFAMLLVRNLGNIDRQEKQRLFDGILVGHILYFISDMIWFLIGSAKLPRTFLTVSMVNLSNALFLCCLTCFWFVYIELSQGADYIIVHRNRLLVTLPAVFEMTLLVLLFIFVPDAVVDDYLNTTNLYYTLFISMPVLYIISSAIRSFVRAWRKENYAVRSQYLVYATYPVIVGVFGILQTKWLRAPLFCFGCTITIIYVYIVSLTDQVSTDPLTGLNNRAQLKKYVASESSRIIGDRVEHYILMMDLNKFKLINDRFGHVEGDIAIKRAADAIRAACSDSPMRPFIARYGGDEFIVVARADDEEQIKELCARIKETLTAFNKDAGAAYELTTSIGYAEYNGDIAQFQDALNRADQALYEEKRMR